MSYQHHIQGQALEVTVVGCSKLKDTEWISRQDPYVCLEYASSKFRTRTCTDGGKNPVFQEKFVFALIEGLRELNVVVWNSNTLTFDDFIGTGKVQLHKVLSQGYDDSAWPLQTKTGRYAGEVKLILHYANATHGHGSNHAPPPPYVLYSMPPPSATYPSYQPPHPSSSSSSYPTASASSFHSPSSSSPYHPSYPHPHPHPPPPYPPSSATAYPPPPFAYPPPTSSAYPPPPYPPPPPHHHHHGNS
ncbi:hypothetical protein RIF29_37726 [Crotalaria pallida]|uniref:C2 domain-containing protein n=1 Tax=Crotalaria pallida TaxID=3830 RepID=A0AAN9ECJ4_CROPI